MEQGLPLAKRLLAIMAELPYIQKRKEFEVGGRRIKVIGYEDLAADVQPLLIKHGVFMLSGLKSLKTEVQETEKTWNGEVKKVYTTVATVEMTFCFINADNPAERFESVFPGMGFDTSDKAVGKATTYAAKDCLRKVFVVPSGEEPEDDDHQRPAPRGAATKAPSKAQDAPAATVDPDAAWKARIANVMSPDGLRALKEEMKAAYPNMTASHPLAVAWKKREQEIVLEGPITGPAPLPADPLQGKPGEKKISADTAAAISDQPERRPTPKLSPALRAAIDREPRLRDMNACKAIVVFLAGLYGTGPTEKLLEMSGGDKTMPDYGMGGASWQDFSQKLLLATRAMGFQV